MDPFMEYFIFHESWISNFSGYNDGGFDAKAFVNTKLCLGFGTIGMVINFDVGGGEGGGVNAPRDGLS